MKSISSGVSTILQTVCEFCEFCLNSRTCSSVYLVFKSLFGHRVSFSRKKLGPRNHRLSLLNGMVLTRVPSSAGFCFVGTHLHSEGFVFSRTSVTLFAPKILNSRGSLLIQHNTGFESHQNTLFVIINLCSFSINEASLTARTAA